MMSAEIFAVCDASGNGRVTEQELGLLQHSGVEGFWRFSHIIPIV